MAAALHVLEVVHIELVLEIVDVGVLLDVDGVEALKLSLEALVFLLVLRLYILNTLEAFIHTLELLTTTLNLVEEFSLVLTQLLDSILHFVHLASLCVNNAADAFFNILLFCVRVEIAADRVEEF